MTPPVVALTVWGVSPRRVPAAIARMGLDRRHLRGTPGLRFAKLLGTGDGRTFTLRDADPLHWALLTVWNDDAAADRFATTTTHRRWNAISDERLDVRMSPLASRGRWAGQEPFTPTGAPTSSVQTGGPTGVPTSVQAGIQTSVQTDGPPGVQTGGPPGVPTGALTRVPARPPSGPVASITRARLRLTRARSFWRAVPPVSADLATVAGLKLAIGIGEAPIGLQGTFSLWQSNATLNDFAHRRQAHADVVGRTEAERWYREELFARFAVRSIAGTFAGHEPLADAAAGFECSE